MNFRLTLAWVGWIVVAGGFLSQTLAAERAVVADEERVVFFQSAAIPELRLRIAEKGQQSLREEPRKYANATLIENDTQRFEKVSVKLKGAAGSYRDFDDRPGLTVRMDKNPKGQKFHGMTKFHLNNAVQDETFLSEWLGWQVFQDAGYPAPQVTHVRLWINDRDMGLYVLREGFDEGFLRRSFGESDGTLYDGGFLQDIDDSLELDWGDEGNRGPTLGQLAIACAALNPEERFRRLEKVLDVPQFLRFMALERLVGHWDGYSLNINNYRLYFPAHGPAVFLPHGMDQLLGDPWAGLYDHSSALVAQQVGQNPVWRNTYEQELRSLAGHLQDFARWSQRLDQMQQRLTPVLTAIDPELAEMHRQQLAGLRERLQERATHLDELVAQGWPQPLDIRIDQRILLSSWQPSPEAESMAMEEVDLEGRDVYGIRHVEPEKPGDVVGAWRHSVVLGRGRYRVEAKILVADVVPIRDDLLRGATLHRNGEAPTARLVGSSDWVHCQDEFEVQEDRRQVEFLLELRAKHGQAWFDRESLILIRLE